MYKRGDEVRSRIDGKRYTIAEALEAPSGPMVGLLRFNTVQDHGPVNGLDVSYTAPKEVESYVQWVPAATVEAV